jgi:hypothetical protein
MNERERAEIQQLEQVCADAVLYVGRANYHERQSLAQVAVTQAFVDFNVERKVKTFEEYETAIDNARTAR